MDSFHSNTSKTNCLNILHSCSWALWIDSWSVWDGWQLVGRALAAIAEGCPGIPVTVKCRIGVDHFDTYEFLCKYNKTSKGNFESEAPQVQWTGVLGEKCHGYCLVLQWCCYCFLFVQNQVQRWPLVHGMCVFWILPTLAWFAAYWYNDNKAWNWWDYIVQPTSRMS